MGLIPMTELLEDILDVELGEVGHEGAEDTDLVATEALITLTLS